jgi:receptor protein-tyrosine kinase
LSEALQKTRYPGLSVLTSGAVPPNPSELLGSQTAKKLLSELSGQFDYVIVDSTPLLAVTDAAILAAGADGVLMMVRYGQTKRDQFTHAVGNLEDVGARLLGAVFTMVPTKGGSSYSYNYRYYGSDDAVRAPRHVKQPSIPRASDAAALGSITPAAGSEVANAQRSGKPE